VLERFFAKKKKIEIVLLFHSICIEYWEKTRVFRLNFLLAYLRFSQSFKVMLIELVNSNLTAAQDDKSFVNKSIANFYLAPP